MKSFETALLKERRIEERERAGRQPQPEPTRTHADVLNAAAKKPIDLTAEFGRASGSGENADAASGEAV